jgi:hypothetical protein
MKGILMNTSSAPLSSPQGSGAVSGVDIDEDGNGLLGDGRLYQLVRQHDTIRERTLQITFDDSGAEAYVFTFG